MKKKFILKLDIIENKKKIFAHINKKSGVVVTEKEVRKELVKNNITAGEVKSKTENLFVFDLIREDLNMVDLTESYGASELPVYNPESEEKPKPVRKTTTRKPRTRRKTTTTKKQTEN
jgi:hypothetical protein|tara:strand:+ start:8263 stop:8616 length:354 start_codon:yes stop_codon:yes gene_type:complete